MGRLSRFRWHAALLLLIGLLLTGIPAPATCSTYNNCLNCTDACEFRLAECLASATSTLSENNCYRASAACRLRCVAVVCTP